MKIRRGLPWILGIALVAALGGCVTAHRSGDIAGLSPLQVRALQTRSYAKQEAKTALKTVLNVLQDDGFVVDYGNTELGLLHANRSITDTFGNYETILDATVNVSEFGDGVKVRLSLQRKKVYSGWWNGTAVNAAPILEPQLYQKFFAQLERGLFIQKQGL